MSRLCLGFTTRWILRGRCPSRSDGPPTKRRDGASPSQRSPCNRMTNDGLSFMADSQVSKAMNSSEGVRRGAVAQHDERRCETMRATRFRRVALFAGRPGGTGKKVKDREIDVAPWFRTGPCASKAANHWQATDPRRAPGAIGYGRAMPPRGTRCARGAAIPPRGTRRRR